MQKHADVALIVWNPDVIQLLTYVLKGRDLHCVGAEPSEGADGIEDVIASCSPAVVVFDLDPPYHRSGAVLMRLLQRFESASFVITCADPILVLRSVPDFARYPLFQKPYPLDKFASTLQTLALQSLNPPGRDVTRENCCAKIALNLTAKPESLQTLTLV